MPLPMSSKRQSKRRARADGVTSVGIDVVEGAGVPVAVGEGAMVAVGKGRGVAVASLPPQAAMMRLPMAMGPKAT